MGEFDVSLVAQYEVEPTLGDVDGLAAGARAGAWVLPGVRVGAAGLTDTTGLEDGELWGLDLFLRWSDLSWLRADAARSEGPVAGTGTTSVNGGLDARPDDPGGASGRAGGGALRVEGSLDLADLGGAGLATGFYEGREEGFSSPGHPRDHRGRRELRRRRRPAPGRARGAGLRPRPLGEEDGGRREDLRLGLGVALSEPLLLQVGLSGTDRAGPLDEEPDEIGRRVDLGARLTYALAPDRAVWAFGQATLEREGPIRANDRLGVGASARLTDALSLTAEASGGEGGAAADPSLGYQPHAGTVYTWGYRLDPRRAKEGGPLLGSDRGTLVSGVSSTVSESWTYTAETTYAAFGERPSLATTLGAAYTPSERWRLDGSLLVGETVEEDGTRVERRALSLGARFADGEAMRAGLRGEVRRGPRGTRRAWTPTRSWPWPSSTAA